MHGLWGVNDDDPANFRGFWKLEITTNFFGVRADIVYPLNMPEKLIGLTVLYGTTRIQEIEVGASCSIGVLTVGRTISGND